MGCMSLSHNGRSLTLSQETEQGFTLQAPDVTRCCFTALQLLSICIGSYFSEIIYVDAKVAA